MSELSLSERRAQVHELLRPDEIRRHRVAEGFALSAKQLINLEHRAAMAALFTRRMSSISRAALRLDALDTALRTSRILFGTEPDFQALKRHETIQNTLADPTITKIDLVPTQEGFSIVEIEPGKIRGLGYGRMVREQTNRAIGASFETTLEPQTHNAPTLIALSDHDRFHIPEQSILAQFSPNIKVAEQGEITDSSAPFTILGSEFKGMRGIDLEQKLRASSSVISDRRPDLESKGAVALLHNTGERSDIEELLLAHMSREEIELLRASIPRTHHTKLLSRPQQEEFLSGDHALFAKPMDNAGTRGIITPDQKELRTQLLNNPKLASKHVFQEGVQTVSHPFESMDIMDKSIAIQDMTVRVTLHVDPDGNIIEATTVGSPDQFLAHGGKSSVITSVEAPR